MVFHYNVGDEITSQHSGRANAMRDISGLPREEMLYRDESNPKADKRVM